MCGVWGLEFGVWGFEFMQAPVKAWLPDWRPTLQTSTCYLVASCWPRGRPRSVPSNVGTILFGGSLSELWHSLPQNPILTMRAPTLAFQCSAEGPTPGRPKHAEWCRTEPAAVPPVRKHVLSGPTFKWGTDSCPNTQSERYALLKRYMGFDWAHRKSEALSQSERFMSTALGYLISSIGRLAELA